MVIHYLQRGVTPAILPNIQKISLELCEKINVDPDDYQKWDMIEEIKCIRLKVNDSSLGELYYGFMQYYENFEMSNSKHVSTVQTEKERNKVLLANFKYISMLGEGSFAKIYKVENKETGLIVALKVEKIGKNAELAKEYNVLKSLAPFYCFLLRRYPGKNAIL